MPVYDYTCQTCHKGFELFLRSYQISEVSCPHCGSQAVEKKISAPGVLVKTSSSRTETTCCGRDERCDTPPCSQGEVCHKER
jgi:putative FmdB family regulatory protein